MKIIRQFIGILLLYFATACSVIPTASPSPATTAVLQLTPTFTPVLTSIISPTPTPIATQTRLPTPTIAANLLSPCFETGNPPIVYGCHISTFVGGNPPDVGDGGPAIQAVLDRPDSVLAASDGSLYIADTYNDRIRRVGLDGKITTIVGLRSAESQVTTDNIPASESTVRFPRGLAQGPDGSIYIADTNHYRIRKISPNGIITTVAGIGCCVFTGEGKPATQALFGALMAVAVALDKTLYIADGPSNLILRINADGIIQSVAGNGTRGDAGDEGPAINAQLNFPFSLAIDNQKNILYIGNQGPIRRMDLRTGIISSIPNTGRSYVATDTEGNLFFTMYNQVYRMEAVSGKIVWIGGNGAQVGFGGDGGLATRATLGEPTGISVDTQGNVYFAEFGNDRVRRIRSDGIIDTVACGGTIRGDNEYAGNAVVQDTQGLGFDKYGNFFFGDFKRNTIRKMDLNGFVTTVAGNPKGDSSADGRLPLQRRFFGPPIGVVFDSKGNLLFIDAGAGNGTAAIRLITPGADGIIDGSSDETIITIAGQDRLRDQADHGTADGGPARKAVFSAARGLALDSRGNLFIIDWLDNRVRKVVPGSDGVFNGSSDEIITTVAGNGIGASTGDGGLAIAASFFSSNWIAFDSKDNLYITDSVSKVSGLQRIRRVDWSTGIISTFASFKKITYSIAFGFDPNDNLIYTLGTKIGRFDPKTGIHSIIAGTVTDGNSGDGEDALQATLRGAAYLTIDEYGNVYTSDNGNSRILKITFVPLTVQKAP